LIGSDAWLKKEKSRENFALSLEMRNDVSNKEMRQMICFC